MDADRYLQEALRNVDWRAERITLYGKTYPIPRLSAWYSNVGASYTYSGITTQGGFLLKFMDELRVQIEEATQYPFNSVLLNYYRNGYDKVSWHSDNETELGRAVCIASISLGAVRTFRMRHNLSRNSCAIALEHGSMLLMEPPMQEHWEHCLPAKKGLDAGRVNLSFRYIVC